MKEKFKNRKGKVLLILICALILFMGVSFAWLTSSINSTQTNVLKSGALSLKLDESATEGISLEDTVPVSDEKGLSYEGYTFSLINNGNVATKYVIYLDDLPLEEGQVRMPDNVIKYNLTKNGVEKETALLTKMGENPQRVVDLGTIEPHTTNTYTLKLWMDYDATFEVMDTYFYAQLRIEAEQENITVDTSDMVMDITETTKTLDLDEDISNYKITSSDQSIAIIDSTTGYIVPRSHGKVIFTVQNILTGAKEDITVTINRKITITYLKQEGVSSTERESDECILSDKNITTCSVTLPNIEVNKGYNSLGWYNNEEKVGDPKDNYETSEDVSLTTKVEINNFNFRVNLSEGIESFDILLADGTTLTNQTSYNENSLYGDEFVISNIKVKTGYTYTDYSLSNGLTEKDDSNKESIKIKLGPSDGVVTLNSKINSYKVTYDYETNGGTSASKQTDTVTYNSKIDLTPTAEKESFEFVGWNTDKDATEGLTELTMETSDITLYAIYKKEVTITFNKNGAVSQTVNSGISYTDNIVTQSCTIYGGNSCKITSPSIEASSATPTVIGYSTAADNHTSSWDILTEKEVSKDATYFAQTKQDETIKSATFETQGSKIATIDKTADSCIIDATYNGISQATGCKVKLPNITVIEGYTVIGWNSDKAATTGTTPNTEISLTESTTTYYTIYKKNEIQLTATFHKNGAASQTISGGSASTEETVEVSCKLDEVYNTETQATECSITTPHITASSATPNVVGYAEDPDATIADIGENTNLVLTSDKTYYAITKSNVKTYTATFNLNGASKQTNESGNAVEDNVTRTCNIGVTYNGESQGDSCTITTPTITASSATPTVCGYTTTSTGTSTCSVKANSEISLNKDIEYYAQTYKAATSKTAIFKIASTTKVAKITLGETSVTNTTDSIRKTCNIGMTYNGESQATSCTITSPEITPATGYQNPFWGNSTSSTSGSLSEAELILEEEETTYYANASISSYTVSYDAITNGGTTSATSKTVNYNESIDLTPTANKTGYTFKGWNTSSSATSGLTSLKMGTSDVTLYAIFVDETKPACTWSTPTNISLKGTIDLTLTCTDQGSKVINKTLSTEDFTVSSTKGSITAVSSPTAVTNGYSYKVTVKGNNAGTFTVSLPAGKISDNAGNSNASATTSTITVEKEDIDPTVSMTGYTYGTTKTDPSINNNTGGGEVTYYYNTNNSNSGGTAWSSVTSATSLNAGTYYMYAVINPTDDYNGITTDPVAFTIAKANGNVTLSETSGTIEYGTSSKTFVVNTNTSGGTLSVSDDNSTATVSISGTKVTIGNLGNINAGTSIKVTVTSEATTNYKESSASYILTIDKANISPKVSMSGYTFAGTKSTPSISGNTGNGTVTYYYSTSNTSSGGTAWSSVTSSSSLAVGTYYMYATVVETTNYNAAVTEPVAFIISGISRTATFNANGNTISTPSGCTISGSGTSAKVTCSCTTTGTSTTCTITAPTITAPSNTPTVIGFSTSASDRTKVVASAATVTLSSSPSYYAQTTKAAITYTATYTKDTTVSAISSTSNSCSISATYNGTAQATSCSVTLPNITAAEGYTTNSCPTGYTCATVPGWYDSSGNRKGAASENLALSASGTFTAKARIVVASELEYDNSDTGLTAADGTDCKDVQCAIDSINRMLGLIILR